MKTLPLRLGLALGLLGSSTASLYADVTVRLSVKFILSSTGTHPSGNAGTLALFQAEVDRGNAILAATGRGYRMQIVESFDIQPTAPAGQPANYWFDLPARSNRSTFENAAVANQALWRWSTTAINFHVNGSSSGQCSFVGNGNSISLGDNIGAGTVLHEIGHFFNLSHTHAGDYGDNPSTPPYSAGDLADGDGLVQTANDNPNITNHDQLCVALFGHNYAAATAGERLAVDSSYENVMSYHNEDQLLPIQMDIWTQNANVGRINFVNGRTWFVSTGGNDTFFPGTSASLPFATVNRAVTAVSSGNDIILLRGGNFARPTGGTITKACTLRASSTSTIGLP